jgi:CheY-like chemotaxis protein
MALQDRLRHMAKLDAMGQLTSGGAHDFNNILAVVLGNIELIQEMGELGHDRDKFIQETISAVLKGRSLTQSLLSFARKAPMRRETASAPDLVHETVEMFRRTSAAGLNVLSSLERDLPNVYIDPGLFQNALLNLLLNARDAIPAGGTISVACKLEPEITLPSVIDVSGDTAKALKIIVADDGPGIPQEVLARVVEPFYSTKPTGSGLGLSMVHGFVEQSGGMLEFESAEGQGTTITMLLPSVAQAVAKNSKPSNAAHDGLQGRHVLVVEDEPALLQLLERFLTDAGAQVTPFTSAEEAMRNHEHWGKVDLLITDIVMPGTVQGDHLADIFLEKYPNKPALLLSGNPTVGPSLFQNNGRKKIVLSKPIERLALLTEAVRLLHE